MSHDPNSKSVAFGRMVATGMNVALLLLAAYNTSGALSVALWVWGVFTALCILMVATGVLPVSHSTAKVASR